MNEIRSLTAVHLCCGAGGITLGFERAGIQTAYAFDINPVVVSTHQTNFPDAPAGVRDICEMRATDFPAADVWTCGIPCGNYSQAGPRTKDDAVSWELVRLLKEADIRDNIPRYLFLENVREYANSNAAQAIRQTLNLVGMDYKEAVFTYADYGVSQLRKRWHLIASRKGKIPWPRPTHAKKPDLFGLPIWIKFGEIREPVENPRWMSPKALKGIIRRQRRKTQVGVDRNSSVHMCLYVVEDDDMMYTMMASAWKGLSRNQAVVVTEGVGFREPTELEWRRAQGFPDSFIFCGNKRQRYEQAGRAVPPPFAEAMARAFVEHLCH